MPRTREIKVSNMGMLTLQEFTKRDVNHLSKLNGNSWNQHFWSHLWPSEFALAEFLSREFSSQRLKGKNILEIGCGPGLAGITSVKLGGHITFLDCVSNALSLARDNAKLNKVRQMKTVQFDWNSDQYRGRKFDFIIASDVLYERKNFKGISELLTTALKANGQAYFADPNRVNRFTVKSYFQKKKFVIADKPIDINWPPWSGPPKTGKCINIFKISKK